MKMTLVEAGIAAVVGGVVWSWFGAAVNGSQEVAMRSALWGAVVGAAAGSLPGVSYYLCKRFSGVGVKRRR